jgi:hypothetical protein
MVKIAAALGLVAALAGAAAGESFPLTPTDGAASGYRVSADHAPVMTPQGVPALPPGTRLTVEAEGATGFQVFVISPKSLDAHGARHSWTGTLSEPGGYKLQFGRERQLYLSQLDLVVTPDPGALARQAPPPED